MKTNIILKCDKTYVNVCDTPGIRLASVTLLAVDILGVRRGLNGGGARGVH